MKAAWFLVFALTASAQTAGTGQTGGVTGVVTDAVTHLPVKKASVTMNIAVGAMGRYDGPQSTISDVSGTFTINNVQPGTYRLIFQHQNYPQARPVVKSVEVKAGEIAGPVTAELIPGAAVSGHIVDEDGDPMPGCNVLIQPAKNLNQGAGSSGSNQDGEYRAYGIAPGKYIVRAQCMQPVFQPRPFSAGPDPPQARAYPMQYYPLASDPKEAQLVELTAGTEKSGIDFQMAPAAVTQVHGAFSPTGADWHGLNPIVQLLGATGGSMRSMTRAPHLDQGKGIFEFQQVFPGSYFLVAFSPGSEESRIGAVQRIEVGDKPVDVTLELRRGMELSGRVEIEPGGNPTQPVLVNQIRIQLTPQFQIGIPFPQTQVNDDGSFTLKGVIPGPWLVRAEGPAMFMKSAWLGNTDVTNGAMDLSGGAAGSLRLMVSTNMATIRGTAPAGQAIFAQNVENARNEMTRMTPVDQTGQYKLDDLAPGTYRLMLTDPGGPMPDEGGQEVTVHEGETVMLDLKPQTAQ